MHLTRFFCVIGDLALSLLFAHVYIVLQNKQWQAFLRLSLPSCRAFGEYVAHNMWNHLLELLFLEQTSGVIVLYVEEIELAKVVSFCPRFTLLQRRCV